MPRKALPDHYDTATHRNASAERRLPPNNLKRVAVRNPGGWHQTTKMHFVAPPRYIPLKRKARLRTSLGSH